jgi:hypothetical protein
MGTFDTDPGIRPSVRAFVADAAAWEAIPDDGSPVIYKAGTRTVERAAAPDGSAHAEQV